MRITKGKMGKLINSFEKLEKLDKTGKTDLPVPTEPKEIGTEMETPDIDGEEPLTPKQLEKREK